MSSGVDGVCGEGSGEVCSGPFGGWSDDELTVLFDQLAALHSASLARMVAVAGELAGREVPGVDGCRDVGVWMAGRAGVRAATGRRWMELGVRLEELPVMAAAFAAGELSFDQVEPASQLADSDSDAEMTEVARRSTAAALAAGAQDARRVSREDEEAAGRDRLRVGPTRDGLGTRIWGRLNGEAGEVVRAALEERAQRLISAGADEGLVSQQEAMAMALGELAGLDVASGDPERATVVIYADADRLDGGDGAALFGSGTALSSDVLRRLSCDCRVQLAAVDAAGQPAALSSPARTVPRRLRRLLVRRDRHCVFPGCERTHRLHAHHLVHWADGGPTALDNLALVCPFHHRRLHDGCDRSAT